MEVDAKVRQAASRVKDRLLTGVIHTMSTWEWMLKFDKVLLALLNVDRYHSHNDYMGVDA